MGWRSFGIGLVVIFAAIFVFVNRSQVPAAWDASAKADPRFLMLAAVCAAIYLLNYGEMYRRALRSTGLHLPFWTAFRLANAAHFLNMTIVNSGGMAGLAAFLPWVSATDRGDNRRGKAISAYLLVALLGHFVFAFVLAGALGLAASDGQVGRVEIVATGAFVLYTCFSAVLIVAAATSRAAVRWIHSRPGVALDYVRRRLHRPPPHRLGDMKAADELYDALRLMIGNPLAMVPTAIHALLAEVAGVAILWSCLRAFGLNPGLEEPLVAYSMGVLFGIVGFLPAGLGFTEAGLAVALRPFGFTAVDIALVVITYRLFEVWVPFLAGAISLRTAFHGSTVMEQ